jgi:hypothetical protein
MDKNQTQLHIDSYQARRFKTLKITLSAEGGHNTSKTNCSWIKKNSAHRWNLGALRRVSAPRTPSQYAQPSPDHEEQASLEEK